MTTELIATDSDSNRPGSLERHAFAVLPTPARIDLKTIDDVRVELARVYRDMRAGRIESSDGTKLAYVLAQLGKLFESGELDERFRLFVLAMLAQIGCLIVFRRGIFLAITSARRTMR